jgi:small GTP-binding protein
MHVFVASPITKPPAPTSFSQVVMLGDTHAGKTSLVLRFVEGSYRKDRTPTVGAFFITKRLQTNGITCKIQIWDTAGQPQFRPLAKMYYAHAAAAILCFDVQSRSSWQVTKFWLEELHRNVPAGNIVLCLCACKVDSSPQVVSTKEAQELAQANGAMFVETSSLKAHNVNLAFQKVAERVLQFQKKEKETGLGKIPVSPGAAIGNNGLVVKHNSVNRYGIVEQEEKKEPIPSSRPSTERLLPTEPHQSSQQAAPSVHSEAAGSSSVKSKRRDKRTRSVPKQLEDDLAPQPGMCGIWPAGSMNTDCVIS